MNASSGRAPNFAYRPAVAAPPVVRGVLAPFPQTRLPREAAQSGDRLFIADAFESKQRARDALRSTVDREFAKRGAEQIIVFLGEDEAHMRAALESIGAWRRDTKRGPRRLMRQSLPIVRARWSLLRSLLEDERPASAAAHCGSHAEHAHHVDDRR